MQYQWPPEWRPGSLYSTLTYRSQWGFQWVVPLKSITTKPIVCSVYLDLFIRCWGCHMGVAIRIKIVTWISWYKQKSCYDQNYAVSVECWIQRCYCELVTNVVYGNFNILVPGSYTVFYREYKKSLRPSPYISSVHSCKKTNKQTSGHNNIFLLEFIHVLLIIFSQRGVSV